MFILDKSNIISYLKKHMPEADFSGDVSVVAIGDGSQTAEDDGDGYVNYIFIVRTKSHSLAVKQSLPQGRVTGSEMTTARNHLEYDAIRIFHAIAPSYVPKVYFIDDENKVFVMEDASTMDRKVSRFQLNHNRMFPKLASQCGTYMADTAFFTSEYYLDTSEFRDLTCHFLNKDMRPIMETGLFLTKFFTDYDSSLGQEYYDFAKAVSEDPDFLAERYKLRHLYMTKAECLLHADLHTSNIFASDDSMKVIDMEFAFCGPFTFDVGYLAGNLISQYASACYRDFPSEEKRMEFKAYILAGIKELYSSFENRFFENWNTYAKAPLYRDVPLLQDDFRKTLYTESPGYAVIVNWFRVAGLIPYPDFDMITDPEKKRAAMTLSLMIDWQIMFHRYEYKDIDDLIDDILFVEKNYPAGCYKTPARFVIPDTSASNS